MTENREITLSRDMCMCYGNIKKTRFTLHAITPTKGCKRSEGRNDEAQASDSTVAVERRTGASFLACDCSRRQAGATLSKLGGGRRQAVVCPIRRLPGDC
eukprot:scaffold196404_cov66-Cyclotella_meneghiniana.AAC.4